MKITRAINGVKLEIELTRNEMCLAYEEIRRDTWESCIRHQIEMNSENLRFTEDFDEEDFVSECMDQVDEEYYTDDYDSQAEEIVFNQAELNDIWVDEEDDNDAE